MSLYHDLKCYSSQLERVSKTIGNVDETISLLIADINNGADRDLIIKVLEKVRETLVSQK